MGNGRWAKGATYLFGNTETLYGLEGTVLKAITRNEIRVGDLFIDEEKGRRFSR